MLGANIDYINDSISDCQATIMQIEETKVGRRRGWEGDGNVPRRELRHHSASWAWESCMLPLH